MHRVVLVGLGHAHLHLVAHADRFRRAGIELVLIDDGVFWYSGSAAGLLGGRFYPDEDVVNSARLAQAASVRFVQGHALSIDRSKRQVQLTNGESVDYDLVSLNVGSEVRPDFPISEQDNVYFTKPISRMPELRQRLEEGFDAHVPVRIAVVGAGPSGTELLLNALALARKHSAQLDAFLITSENDVMTQAPQGAREVIRGLLDAAGVHTLTNTRVEIVTPGAIKLEDANLIPFDYAIVAPGLWASDVLDTLDLPYDKKAGLLVHPTLCSIADDRVFGTGDCVDITSYSRPKLGVFGVRSAPYLLENLIRRTRNEPMLEYHPQEKWFSALSLGDGTGLAMRGDLWWRGRTALWLKEYFDISFLRKYQRLAASAPD